MTTDPQPLRADARANRESLLAAAAALFTERGIDVPYEEIAQRAGVGRATLYRHFPTRDLLLTGLLDRLIDELEAVADEVAARPDGLFEVFAACVQARERHLPIVDLVNQGATPEQLSASRERFVALLAEPLARAQAAALVRRQLTVNDVRLLLVMVSSLSRITVSDADRDRAVILARSVLTGSLG